MATSIDDGMNMIVDLFTHEVSYRRIIYGKAGFIETIFYFFLLIQLCKLAKYVGMILINCWLWLFFFHISLDLRGDILFLLGLLHSAKFKKRPKKKYIEKTNTYCVVFLFCFSLYCVPYAASFSGLFILIATSVYSRSFI